MDIIPALYLIPVNISTAPLNMQLPCGNIEITKQIRHFIVENTRTARRFLKKCDPAFNIAACSFFELNVHSDPRIVGEFLQPLREGFPMGIMSEAGCPAVADPGSLAVAAAQREGFRVVPLPGPSSIIMSLMASGFNGQGFTFNGYIPIEQKERERKIKELESISRKTGQTQIFIETPYRNKRMLEALLKTLQPSTMLCVAAGISDTSEESIISLPVSEWKKRVTGLEKQPAVFLIHVPH